MDFSTQRGKAWAEILRRCDEQAIPMPFSEYDPPSYYEMLMWLEDNNAWTPLGANGEEKMARIEPAQLGAILAEMFPSKNIKFMTRTVALRILGPPLEAKKIYKKLILQYHPDKGGNEFVFRAIRHAYQILKGQV